MTRPVAQAIKTRCEYRVILACGKGIGISIAVNKMDAAPLPIAQGETTVIGLAHCNNQKKRIPITRRLMHCCLPEINFSLQRYTHDSLRVYRLLIKEL
ncbi:RpiB/LacA/LacB family sugar-phosphate isomerase [Erwinia sorbitola]|uniref:Uncharacterized protein n=1 Tax=Erwinia sorbitola TaxID=2681984 RepID=A0A6I6EKB1_9GAMM|nr:hypothetical protein GN242_05620 [Erwinia sorbitola]